MTLAMFPASAPLVAASRKTSIFEPRPEIRMTMFFNNFFAGVVIDSCKDMSKDRFRWLHSGTEYDRAIASFDASQLPAV